MKDGIYTLAEIKKAAGDLNRHAQSANEEWARSVLRAMHVTLPLPRLTRRQAIRRRYRLLRYRLSDYRYRVGLAADVLRNRHDCDY